MAYEMIEQKITKIIESTVNRLGFELVNIKLQEVNSKVLEILIDRADHTEVSVTDCALVSRNIAHLLDIEEIITDKYFLAVSSSGIERNLIRFKDYIRFTNSLVKIKLATPINGRVKLQGIIITAKDNTIELKVDDKELIVIPFAMIKSAHLVLTDSMFKKLLNNQPQ